MKTVLLDMTALNTSRRLRGIGRHVRELAVGLARLSADELHPLRIQGITHMDVRGRFELTDDLAGFEGSERIREATRIDDAKARWERRAALWHVAMSGGADLVHLPDLEVSPWLMRIANTRTVATCHDLSLLRQTQSPPVPRRAGIVLRRSLQARRYGGMSHIIAISSYTAQEVRTLLGDASPPVSVVYNGIDLDRWRPDAERDDGALLLKYGLRLGAYALYVGDATWRKNTDGMLRGLRHARELRPDLSMQLVWAGRLSAQDVSAVTRTARALGVRNALHMLSFVPDHDLATLYRGAGAHLFVSRHEGFGLPVVEAMACGCPVITTRRTALAEVAGDAAVDVDPEDHDGIGEALVRVVTDQALRDDLRARGMQRARMFTNERQARATLAIYKQVLGA